MAENKNRRKVCRTAISLAACVATAFLLFSCVQNADTATQANQVPSVSITGTESPSPFASASPTVEATEPSDLPSLTASQTAAAPQAVCVKTTGVYAGPVESTAAVVRLKAGDSVDILSSQNGWVQVSVAGVSGYVNRENLITKSAPTVQVPQGDWTQILVNPTHLLPAGYTVSPADFAGGQVDERISAICQNMFADAQKDGAPLKLVDAYRSRALQSELYEKKVQSYLAKGYSRTDAEREAATITARPDTSEHQTGLALDIVTPSYTSRDSGFANTRAFYWLNTNAANYGFTLRYGKDKEPFTKVIYEPWHWRFVGVMAAKAMKESGQCLEEYF
jgi:zinc D-Ala-D-Ala carboxypeptidase